MTNPCVSSTEPTSPALLFLNTELRKTNQALLHSLNEKRDKKYAAQQKEIAFLAQRVRQLLSLLHKAKEQIMEEKEGNLRLASKITELNEVIASMQQTCSCTIWNHIQNME